MYHGLMARNPRFESEKVRFNVVAALMLGVLLVSLASAYWFSTSHDPLRTRPVNLLTLQIGDLTLGIPETWQQAETDGPANRHPLAVFVDPENTNCRLTITLREMSAPATPVDVLYHTLDRLRQGQLFRTHDQRTLRYGSKFAVFYVGSLNSGPNQVVHCVTVLSEDAQRYWILDLSETVSGRWNFTNAGLLYQIAHSMTDHGLLDATLQQLHDASIWFTPPPGLRALVQTDWDGASPLTMLPPFDGTLLSVTRLRSVPDHQVSGSDDPLSPRLLIRDQFEHEMGRQPLDSEIQELTISGVSAYRAVMNRVHDREFSRQLWYVRPHDRRGLLIEVLFDSSLLPPISIPETVTQLIEASLATTPGSLSHWSGPDAIDRATERGVEIVQRQMEQFPRLVQPRWVYHLIDGIDDVVGFMVERVLPIRPTEEMQLHGRTKAVLFSQLRFEFDSVWSAARDGYRSRQQVRRYVIRPQRSDVTSAEESVFDDGELTFSSVRVDGQKQEWSVPVPDGYVRAYCEDLWPVDDRDLPALVWMSQDRLPPSPCWITVAGQSAGRVTALRIRRMMSMDADMVHLDDHQQVHHAQWPYRSGRTVAGAQASRRVPKEVLVSRVRWFAEHEQEVIEELDRDDY